jgi:tetratricopeptide (TPR) repeat protein
MMVNSPREDKGMLNENFALQELVSRSRQEAAQGNYVEAYRLLRDLPLTVSDLPEAVLLKASLALSCEQYEDALRGYNEVISVMEVCAAVHLHRFECLLRLGRLAQAERELEAGESPLQGHHARHLMLARIAARRGQAVRAIGHLKAAYYLHPGALTCAAHFPELRGHLLTLQTQAMTAWRFDHSLAYLN